MLEETESARAACDWSSMTLPGAFRGIVVFAMVRCRLRRTHRFVRLHAQALFRRHPSLACRLRRLLPACLFVSASAASVACVVHHTMTSPATCLPSLHRERLDATDDEAIHRRCVDHEDSCETATTLVRRRAREGDGPQLQAFEIG